MRLVPNSTLSAASAADGPSSPPTALAAEERDVDLGHLVVRRTRGSRSRARRTSASAAVPRSRAMMRVGHHAAWPSANTPAFGVPTLVDVADGVDAGERRLEGQRVDRDPAVDGQPRLRDDRRRAVHRDAEEQVVGHLAAVAQHRDLARPGRARAPAARGATRCRARRRRRAAPSTPSGDGGIGTPKSASPARSPSGRAARAR